MNTVIIYMVSALWLGILTSISPCPLATNIAAISYIARRLDKPRMVFFSGLLYAIGRTLVYLVLGIGIVASVLSVPMVSNILQKYMNKVLGPILIIVGMFLLEMISLNFSGSVVTDNIQRRAEKWGVWGALLLGILFALSFCPVSAALFFGSLVSLAIKYNSPVIAPALYGMGTAVPVIVFAVLIALGGRSVGRAFNKLTIFERVARYITGGIFILVGIYYCLAYIFGVFT